MGPPEDREEAAAARHDLRTRLNHIVGFGDILKVDAEEAGRPELAALFGSIRESALSLRDPLLSLMADDPPQGEARERIEQSAYGALFNLVGTAQEAKGRASNEKGLSEDIGRILEAANAVLELLARPSAGEEPERDAKAGAGAAGGEPSAEEGRGAGEARARILLVDDDAVNRDILRRHLERQGHELRTVSSGSEALALLATEDFDVMILDVMMPGMNGYQLIEKVRGDEKLDDLYIIVISALSDTRSVARCIQLGAEDYLPREFEPVVLKARIESCLEKKRLAAERELYVAALVEAQERLRAELRGGAAYVRNLLPPRISLPSLRSDWMFIPSASLGGDAFGYGPMPGGRLSIYLVDVSGHGIEAALYSVTLLNILKTQVLPGADFADPASVLARLNASFRMEEQNNLYFTAWYGIYDAGARRLDYSSAGSPPAVLVLPGGGAVELAAEGAIVGMDPDSAYANRSSPVPAGSRLFLFSDGAYEVRTRSGGMLGLEGFVGLLSARAAGTAPGVSALDGVLRDVQSAAASTRFSDDVSLVELEF